MKNICRQLSYNTDFKKMTAQMGKTKKIKEKNTSLDFEFNMLK